MSNITATVTNRISLVQKQLKTDWNFCYYILFYIITELHLILQLLCSLTPTSLSLIDKIVSVVQRRYLDGVQQIRIENVNFIVNGHMKPK